MFLLYPPPIYEKEIYKKKGQKYQYCLIPVAVAVRSLMKVKRKLLSCCLCCNEQKPQETELLPVFIVLWAFILTDCAQY